MPQLTSPMPQLTTVNNVRNTAIESSVETDLTQPTPQPTNVNHSSRNASQPTAQPTNVNNSSRNASRSNRSPRRVANNGTRNRGRNFTDDMISNLLDYVDMYLPLNSSGWELVSNALNVKYPETKRDGDSVKKKFQSLYQTK